MGGDEMTTDIPIAPHLKSKEAIIEGIERGLADIKAGRTVSHEAAMIFSAEDHRRRRMAGLIFTAPVC
jgi:predicted transcriptional regulator